MGKLAGHLLGCAGQGFRCGMWMLCVHGVLCSRRLLATRYCPQPKLEAGCEGSILRVGIGVNPAFPKPSVVALSFHGLALLVGELAGPAGPLLLGFVGVKDPGCFHESEDE